MAAATNTTPQISSKSPTIRRILREAAELSSSPCADYTAEPLETDLFEWHFTLRGPPKSVYSEGLYHGRIVLPPTYPLRPPSFRFTTPSGRFEANREICLSISGHHEETWQPAWGIRTALVALRSFMETDARGQLGGLDTTDETRRHMALESRLFRCSTCGRTNLDILSEAEKQAKDVTSSSSTTTSEVQVPAELNMAWKDEVGVAPSQKQDDGRRRDGDSDTAADLAEGFVQTVPVQAARSTGPSSSSSSASAPAPATGSRATCVPSSAVASASLDTPRPPQQVLQAQPASSTTTRPPGDGVPLWLDRAIVALVIFLAALLLKVLFGV